MEQKQKLGKEPAFPVIDDVGTVAIGISKRFYAACAAMQGILASSDADVQLLNDNQKAEYSFIMADKLLKQENE